MANYQPAHSSTPNDPGENTPEAQSTGTRYSAQHVKGVMHRTAQPLRTQTRPANEGDEAVG